LRARITYIALAILTVSIVGLALFSSHRLAKKQITTQSYDQFLGNIDRGEIKSATVKPNEILVSLSNGQNYTVSVYTGSELSNIADRIHAKNPAAAIAFQTAQEDFSLTNIVLLGFFLVFGVGLILLFRQLRSGGSISMKMGNSGAKLLTESQKRVTFKDVAGVEEAQEELHEVVEFLRQPQRFQRLGGRIPKGVLLMGPPGTGKTLLARAIAGEANVPFFSISGSDFVEMFVGVGASRVRNLFAKAKKKAPCIVFIDEIDSVGRQRSAGATGSHDERDQTLNQLLVEMDGFESNDGVILIASTNRPDILDPALLRPGRFDRRVMVNRPDIKGREGILAVHTRNIPIGQDVSVKVIARGTPGFTGADLANLVNEAALNAARRNRKSVVMADFELAKDKVLMGAERRSAVISDDEKTTTAYHEAGHTLVGMMIPKADPVHKVTIIPRGMAMGVTQQLPQNDRYLYTRDYIEGQISILMGGRIAEEIFLNQMTTGASNDIERASELARKMVCDYGMSNLGPLCFVKKEGENSHAISEDTAIKIDQEVTRIVTEQYNRARHLILENQAALVRLAGGLLEYESLDEIQIRRLIAGKSIDESMDEELIVEPTVLAPAQTVAAGAGNGYQPATA